MIEVNLAKPKRIRDPRLLREIRKLACSACGRIGPCDASHIRSVGAGGPDTDWNVWPHCRDCHIVWHRVGWSKFFEKFPRFKERLKAAGWIIEEQLGLWHPKLLNGGEEK